MEGIVLFRAVLPMLPGDIAPGGCNKSGMCDRLAHRLCGLIKHSTLVTSARART